MITFEDVYIDKKFGEVKECCNCYGSGITNYEDECEICDGNGFVKDE